MAFLLDTNTCIQFMRGHEKVVARMSAIHPHDCAISTITAYELFTGVEKCQQPDRELQKVRLLMNTIVEVEFNENAARESAKIRAMLEAQGQMIGPTRGTSSRWSVGSGESLSLIHI